MGRSVWKMGQKPFKRTTRAIIIVVLAILVEVSAQIENDKLVWGSKGLKMNEK